MTIDDLLHTLVYGARNAGLVDDIDTDGAVYTLDEKHRAIRGVLNDFIRRTRCTRQTDTVTLTASSASISFEGVDDFAPDRIIEDGIAVVSDSNYSACDIELGVKRVGPADIRQAAARSSSTYTGTPRLISFTSSNSDTGPVYNATVFPTPKASGTITVTWSPPLTDFTPGGDGANNTTINLPADLAEVAVTTGGVLWLQKGQIENVELNNPLKADYEALVTRSMGLGNLGVNFIQRESVREVRRRRF